MIRDLVPDSDLILHTPATPVDLDADPASLQALIGDLWDTLNFHSAYGLAAVQIGVPFRMFVMKTDAKKLLVINPLITFESEEKGQFDEGCLSYPDVWYRVERSNRIKVSYYDENLDHKSHYLNGMDARVFLHEYNHTRGITMLDIGVKVEDSF